MNKQLASWVHTQDAALAVWAALQCRTIIPNYCVEDLLTWTHWQLFSSYIVGTRTSECPTLRPRRHGASISLCLRYTRTALFTTVKRISRICRSFSAQTPTSESSPAWLVEMRWPTSIASLAAEVPTSYLRCHIKTPAVG